MGELAPGFVFAGHRIEDVAGRGGMGVVYRATQLALDRTMALKVIAPGLLEDQAMRARFVRESKVAASIDHPNVIPIYYVGEERGIAYIAMRNVGGDDIRSLVRREGRLAPERAAHRCATCASAARAARTRSTATARCGSRCPATIGAVIPISVGKQPRQLALAGDTVYVTNYGSSDLYEIDAETSHAAAPPSPSPSTRSRSRPTATGCGSPASRTTRRACPSCATGRA